jgi:hypothetical protein
LKGEKKVSFIKMLGLVAIAAIVALALMGVPSAMANSTQLCENDTKTDPPAAGECKEPMTVHFISVNSEDKPGHLKLLQETFIGPITLECESLISGEVLLGLVKEGPVVIHAEIQYSNCLNGAVVKVIKQGLISVLHLMNELADVTAAGFEVLVETNGAHCVYNTEKLVGHSLGPLNKEGDGDMHITYTKAEVNHGSGFLCPSTTKLDALFESLTPFYTRL